MDRNELIERLQRFLPLGSQLIWNEWREEPSIQFKDLDGDGKEEMFVSFVYEDNVYTTIFKHDDSYWYAVTTERGADQFRVKGIDLYPAYVRDGNKKKWGYINHKGNFVSPLKYEDAQDFQANGLAAVKMNGKYGLINRFGQFIVWPRYDSINPFSEGRAVVMDGKGFKVLNRWGKELTKKTYSFIGNYQNGMAMFAGKNTENQYLYGFLNKQGKEVIPLQFESVTNFNDGKAVAKRPDGKFELINQKGKALHSYEYAFVGELSEGLMAFQEKSDSKHGYMNESGKTMIEPSFTRADPFKFGGAVVNKNEDVRFNNGLIDHEGKFIIDPNYSEIVMLGENRLAVGKAINKEIPMGGTLYAIVDINGKFLTDHKFTNVLEYKNGFASASDWSYTFFIDKSGQIVRNLPIAKGGGTLSFEGELIKGMIDQRLRYYNLKGMLVWSPNQIIPLNSRFRVIERKYKPNKDYLVYYPEIQGMSVERIQKQVNKRLAELSGVKDIPQNKQLEYSYSGEFDISFFKKQLLVLELNGYNYPFGAAHGMPVKIFAHVDLESGAFYELKDLFKSNSYVKVLSDIIGEQIKTDPQYSYVFPDTYKGISPDQTFYVDENNLYIYFAPYEIAPYAAGFPTFKIPFSAIDEILYKEAAFWCAFH
ncbi:WG repeat-containing protein [Bacillus sp. CGMCC 1.16607]|uniref:WG repeat-containing protein n=1 Tax=Bacillus sp. CGMCC 1.16607 TaxID=3351842 RepID=UPI003645D4E9